MSPEPDDLTVNVQPRARPMPLPLTLRGMYLPSSTSVHGVTFSDGSRSVQKCGLSGPLRFRAGFSDMFSDSESLLCSVALLSGVTRSTAVPFRSYLTIGFLKTHADRNSWAEIGQLRLCTGPDSNGCMTFRLKNKEIKPNPGTVSGSRTRLAAPSVIFKCVQFHVAAA